MAQKRKVQKSDKKKDVEKSKKSPSKVRRHIFWYASVVLVAVIVVGGVYVENNYQNNSNIVVEKPVVSRTKTTQIAVVSEPGIVISAPAVMTLQPDTSRLEAVQSMMVLVTGLEKRLTETEAVLQSIAQKSAVAGVSKENLMLSEMVSELRGNYQRGDVLLEQISQLQLFTAGIVQDAVLSDALETLLSVTPTEGPVTLAELAMIATKIQTRGLPSVSNMMVKPAQDTAEVSFIDSIKNWISNLIKVRKLADAKAYDLTQPWVKDMEQLQVYLLRGRADTAQNFMTESEHLANDKRLIGLGHTLDLYLRQQQALQSVLNAYAG